MSAFEPLEGRCQCGAVRYRVDAPAEVMYHCHCAMCRRLHGTLFATYAVVARRHLTILAGAEAMEVFDSSDTVHRRRCRSCGCQILLDVDTKPDKVWYTPGTLNGHPGHPPDSESHIFVGSKLPWLALTDGLPQYPGFLPKD